MPELPEVETIKRVIEPQMQGLIIEKVIVKRERSCCRSLQYWRYVVLFWEAAAVLPILLLREQLRQILPQQKQGRQEHLILHP